MTNLNCIYKKFKKGKIPYSFLPSLLCLPQVTKYMGDVGERITHSLRPSIHSAEVDNKPVRTVLLRHYEVRRVPFRLGPLDDILPQYFVDLLIDEALDKRPDAVVSCP
jgi:hypothetical protein